MRETLTRGGGIERLRVAIRLAAAIVTAAAVGALALGAVIFEPTAANEIPISGSVQVAGLPASISAAVSGAAIAFAALGRTPTRRSLASNTRAAVLFVPGTWVVTSRWVYENLYTIQGIDFGRLLRIESAFDIALIAAAAAMARAFFIKSRDQRHP